MTWIEVDFSSGLCGVLGVVESGVLGSVLIVVLRVVDRVSICLTLVKVRLVLTRFRGGTRF